MELQVSPICGRDYVSVEQRSSVAKRAPLGGTGCCPPLFRGLCWNPLTKCLLVCDSVGCCVHALSASLSPDSLGALQFSLTVAAGEGDVWTTIGEPGSSPGQFLLPSAVDVSLRGEIAVADAKLNRVQIFSGSGDLEHLFGRPGTAPGEFRGLGDLKFTLRGHLAVLDTGNHRIQVISATGIVKQVVGRYGWKAGELSSPCALAVNREGDLFVCDEGNKRIQRFSATGTPLVQWGSRRGPVPDPNAIDFGDEMDVYGYADTAPALYSVFETPCDLAQGVHGEILVCDSGKHEIFIFSDVGECLHILRAPQFFQTSTPSAIALCANFLIVVGRAPQDNDSKDSPNVADVGVNAQAEDAGADPEAKNETQVEGDDEVDDDEGEHDVTASIKENHQVAQRFDYVVAVFPPAPRVFVGCFEPLHAHCVLRIACFLTYEDALHLRLVSRYFHRVCRRLRNEWKLFPLTPGRPAIRKYNRVFSPATGLAAVEDAFQKWGLRIFKPSSRIRKHVMDFHAGFSSALSTLYGPLFCYQHEEILHALFRFHAASNTPSSSPAREKDEIDRRTFIEIVTQIEEVRMGFLTWEQCTAFRAQRQRGNTLGSSSIHAPAVCVPAIRTEDNLAPALGGMPLPSSLRLVENAQQHQLTKLLHKLQAL